MSNSNGAPAGMPAFAIGKPAWPRPAEFSDPPAPLVQPPPADAAVATRGPPPTISPPALAAAGVAGSGLDRTFPVPTGAAAPVCTDGSASEWSGCAVEGGTWACRSPCWRAAGWLWETAGSFAGACPPWGHPIQRAVATATAPPQMATTMGRVIAKKKELAPLPAPAPVG